MSAVLGRRRFVAGLTGGAIGASLVAGRNWLATPPKQSGKPDRSLDHVIQTRRLIVGVDPSYPPFESIDPNQQVVGFDLDLASAIAFGLFATMSIKVLGLDGFYDALRARQIDVAVSSIVPSRRAGKEIAFSSPYFNAGLVLCSTPSRTVRDLGSLAGHRVGVELGSDADEYLQASRKRGLRLTIVRFDDVREALLAATKGQVAAALTDSPTAALLRHEISGYTVAVAPVTHKPYAVALRSADQALLGAINFQLTRLQTDGTLREIEQRWL